MIFPFLRPPLILLYLLTIQIFFFSHEDPVQLEKLINTELKEISNWFKLNKLSLNIDKTNFMIFKNKYNNKPMPDFKIEIDNKHIEQVDTTKFLGIPIDNNLTWKAHTSHVTKIVSKYNGIIRKVRPFLNSESLHTLYNTLILPYLTYCTIVWGDKNNSNLNSLFITQKKIVRTCTNSLWLAHTTPLFISLKKLKFFDIYSYQLATHMYRYHHDLLPPGLPNNHFPTQANIHDYNTRQANDLHVDPTNTKLALNNIKTQGPLTWNKLNIKIKNSPSLASFKTNLKKHILKGVMHPCALFLKTWCIFSKNKATLDKVSYGSGLKCSKELKKHSFTSIEAIVVKLQ